MTDHGEYYKYLRQRSRLGSLYRKYWLYPRLSDMLKGKTLDIGCGIGDLLVHRPNTVGLDVNPRTVEWCKSQELDVQLMEVDHLPFGCQTFDSVILDNVLEHIEEPRLILTEVHRVLANDGILVIGVPGTLGYSRDPDHKVFYSKEKLVNTVTSSGFNVQRIFAMPLNLDWLESRMRQYCVYGVFRRARSHN